MRTTIDIDEKLLRKVMQLGGFMRKKAAVEAALRALVRYHEQRKILRLFGKVEFYPEYDYKAMR